MYTWSGNYKGAVFQGSSWSGPGAGSYVNEDPFHPVLDEQARITGKNLRHLHDAEDPSYWATEPEAQPIGAQDSPVVVDLVGMCVGCRGVGS